MVKLLGNYPVLCIINFELKTKLVNNWDNPTTFFTKLVNIYEFNCFETFQCKMLFHTLPV